MGGLPRIGDLEIDQDLDFQRRAWAFQRVGWAALGVTIVLGLLGGFGGRGPLAAAELGAEGDPLRIELPRLTRHGRPEVVRVHVAAAAPDSTIAVWLDAAWVDGLTLRQVDPEPEEVRIGPDRVTYRFHVADPTRAVTVRFSIEPLASFSRRGEIGVEGGTSHRFRQFVYP